MLVHGNSHFFTRWYTAVQMTGFYFWKTPIPEKNGSCMEVRLNSPHSKFEITNMVDNQVDLTPEDIPGASFSEEEIGKLTIAQLKYWLKCCRINQNANKKELLER